MQRTAGISRTPCGVIQVAAATRGRSFPSAWPRSKNGVNTKPEKLLVYIRANKIRGVLFYVPFVRRMIALSHIPTHFPQIPRGTSSFDLKINSTLENSIFNLERPPGDFGKFPHCLNYPYMGFSVSTQQNQFFADLRGRRETIKANLDRLLPPDVFT